MNSSWTIKRFVLKTINVIGFRRGSRRRTQRIPWEDIMGVLCEGHELWKVSGL